MPYTPELKELIKKVEATRAERVERKKKGEEVPFLSLDGRKDILNYLKDHAESGDRIVIMGARDDTLTEFAKKILKSV